MNVDNHGMHSSMALRPQTVAKRPNGRPHLLGLPAELRNQIFEYVLAQESYRKVHLWPMYLGCDVEQPPLALVNRQVRKEILPVYSNQASVCIFAYVNSKWEESKCWIAEQSYFIREIKIVFTKYAGDILTISGFVGQEPSYELTLVTNERRVGHARRMGDYTYVEEELREFVESNIRRLMDKDQKNWFGLDEYAQFGDVFLEEYYEF